LRKAGAALDSLPDPLCVSTVAGWCGVLAPDCSRIELASLSKDRDEARLLYSMGWETGNMHSPRRKRPPKCSTTLHHAGPMAPQSLKGHAGGNQEDWKKWQSDWKRSAPR